MTTAVTCPTVRIHPAIIAQAAATCAEMLGGRFILGVGTGEALNEHILGDPWPSADVRLEMLEEAVEADARALDRRGRDHRRQALHGRPRPDLHAPRRRRREIYVSGFGPKATELAARIGDGYISTAPDAELVAQFKDASGGKPAQAGAKVAFAPDPGRGRGSTPTGCGRTPGCPASWPRSCRRRSTSSRPPSWSPGVDAGLGRRGQRPRASTSSRSRSTPTPGYDELYVANMGPHYLDMIEFYGKDVLPALA